MKYAIVYSSHTGNTKMLAEALRESLPAGDCIYFGAPDNKALAAERIYLGFWTDKGSCDKDSAEFLKRLDTQEIFLFGTAGFGGNREYFDKVLSRCADNIPGTARRLGSFMCQGKMPLSVRERYEKMLKSPVRMPNIHGMIDNFDKALSHPDSDDLEALKKAVLSDGAFI